MAVDIKTEELTTEQEQDGEIGDDDDDDGWVDDRAARRTVSAYGRIKYGRLRCRLTGTRTVR
jgi:hypothetical protein